MAASLTRLIGVLLLALLGAVPAAAQPLHNHPQLATFGPEYTLKTLEAQCHWAPGNDPILMDPETVVFDLVNGTLGANALAHTHFLLNMQQCPIYSEMTGPKTCDFAVVLHKTTGQAFIVNDYQLGIRDIVWDATGTGVSPPMIGDPLGTVVFTGHLTIDPTMAGSQSTMHGWFSPQPHVETFYDNGDTQSVKLFASYYSMLDPTAPETDGLPWAGAHCSPHSARHSNDIWGDNLVDVGGMFLPVAPIDQTYPILVSTAGYGGQLLGADLQVRADLDLHHLNGGMLVFDQTGDGDISAWVSLNPSGLGAGDHKIALMRNQLSSEGNDAVNTLLVFNVTVGQAFPPPQTTTVPNVVGMLQAQATSTIQNAQLVIGTVTSQDSTQPTGTVLAQTPTAGSTANVGSAVNLVVAQNTTPVDPWVTIATLSPGVTLQRNSTEGKLRVCEGTACLAWAVQ